jgi:hypothetical protein
VKGSDFSMLKKENKEVDKMIVYKRKTCETHVRNYLFITSVGFNLGNNKMALTLNMSLDPERAAENAILMSRQPEFTQNFLYGISSLGRIVKVVLFDENNFCLVKEAIFSWVALEEEITEMIKNSYKDKQIKFYRGHSDSFGKTEEEMVKALEEFSEERIAERSLKEALSFLNIFNV